MPIRATLNHVKGNRSREGVMKLENFASDHLFSDFLIFVIFTQTYNFFFEMVNIDCVYTKQNVKKRSATIITKLVCMELWFLTNAHMHKTILNIR